MNTRIYDRPKSWENEINGWPEQVVKVQYESEKAVVPEYSDAEIGAMVRMDMDKVSTFDIATELGMDMKSVRTKLLELRQYYKTSTRLTHRPHPGRAGA
jgi:ribosomal protein S24E